VVDAWLWVCESCRLGKLLRIFKQKKAPELRTIVANGGLLSFFVPLLYKVCKSV
jgi:hypothetical protein